MNFNSFHYSWKPILREFYTEEFLHFKNEILPKEKYYPEESKIFRVFSLPLNQIKAVYIGTPRIPNLRKLEEEGLFVIPFSFTRGVDVDHTPYWEPFIKKLVYFIARNHPCIWILPTTKAQAYTANLPVKSIFKVLGYNDDTIKIIPLSEDYNYVFKSEDLDHINTILTLLKKQKFNF